MKKILAVLLAVVLVATLSLSAVMLVSATSPQIVVSSVEANPGDTVDVTISLQNNPGLSSMKLKVAFPEGITLNKPVTYDITSAGGQATQPGKVTSPATLNWVSPFEDVTGDQTFATLSFTVADDATPGDKAITVTYDQADVYNLAEDDVVFGITNGKITVADNSTPPPSTDPTIVVSSVEAAKGDTVDVAIALQNNPGLSSMKLKVAFP
ncbi:MAG: hypothetical protein J5662_05960, partial [Clostridia bacterium]|nr:hypothetical protein [Clostridia bacterium]